MKKVLAILLALAMVLSLCTVVSFAEDDNLLEDPCLDNDEIMLSWPNGWVNGIRHEWDSNSVDADGSGSIALENGDGHHQHCTQPVSLEGGKIYILSGWIKLSDDFHSNAVGACGAYICINLPRETGEPSGVFASITGWKDTNDVDHDWTYFESTYTPEEDVDTYFSCCLWGAQGTAYFDDLYLGEAGSPYKPVEPVYLSDLDCKFWITYHAQSDEDDPQFHVYFNRQEGTNANGTENILIGGKEYEKGIQLHASDLPEHKEEFDEPKGEVVYDISAYTGEGSVYNAFKCVFGGLTQVDSTIVNSGHKNATKIYLDGVLAYESEYIDNTEVDEITVAIPTGTKEIRLVSLAGTEFNSEWFAWADAKLTKDDNAGPKPTEEPTPTDEPTAAPTDEPTATDAPADPTDEPTTAPTDAPKNEPTKKGCKNVIVSGAVVVAVAIAATAVVLKKKED